MSRVFCFFFFFFDVKKPCTMATVIQGGLVLIRPVDTCLVE